MNPTRLEQLKRALDAGLIDQDTYDAAVAAISAQLNGSGAIAQGQDALALGEKAANVEGNNYGDINTGLIIQLGTRPGAGKDDLRRAYLARILAQADQLPLFAGDSAKAHVRLSSVYTALLTERSEHVGMIGHEMGLGRFSAVSALDVLNVEPKLVLLGGPGSGKSTFANFVALCMAGEMLGTTAINLKTLTAPIPPEPGSRDEKPKPQHWVRGALLPVHVVLRDLASELPAPGTPVNAETVWRHIERRLKQATLGEFSPHLRDELLKRGGLILLDGLDEVPDARSRREQIKQAVQDFTATFYRCRFLVTSRTYAYQRQDWKLNDFGQVGLLPFTLGQIHAFVDAWYTHMVGLLRLTEADANSRAEVLKRTVERNERIRELAERPLLLTLIAQLQTEGGGALPEKRAELYDKAVDMLLNKWEGLKIHVHDDGTKEVQPSLAEWLDARREDIRKQLNRLAFEAHRDQPELTGSADIRQGDLIAALMAASKDKTDTRFLRLEEYLRDRAGILAAHGVGMYQFPHRSFQEYLVACHLTDDEFPEKLAGLVRGDPNRWREATLLAAAKAAGGSSLSAWALAEALCVEPATTEKTDVADQWGALLAGRVLVESADLGNVARRNVDKRERIRRWQVRILGRNTLPATERALAGRTLAALVDPRPEVMTLDGMHFCLVPPGPFLMGSRDDDGEAPDEEKPQHPVGLTYPYFMARFPVTVAQWREYAQLSGKAAEGEDSLLGRDNDPVVYVSWHEAVRFCEFLTQAWRGLLPKGFIVTLPSEAEWEKAARGGRHVPAHPKCVTAPQLANTLSMAPAYAQMPNPFRTRSYPWGEVFDANKANAEMAVGETSAVGCYPVGDSPYGCEEMSGNVWEWTRSLWGWGKDSVKRAFAYPYQPDDPSREDLDAGDEVYRVVRGGAFRYGRGRARCACRYGLQPDFRLSDLGFRVVLRSPPVGSL